MLSQYRTCHMAGLVTNAKLGTSQAAVGTSPQRLYFKHTITHISQSGRNRDETPERVAFIHPQAGACTWSAWFCQWNS